MILATQGLASGYGRMEILHGIDMRVEEGKITCIIGPNGSGKSTLLKTLVGLVPPRRGKVLFNNGGTVEDITGIKPYRAITKGICMVPQGRQIFQRMTVLENLRLACYTIKAKSQIRESIEKIFNIFPFLREKKDQLAGTLSGGQQSMLSLARALVLNPKVILLDEPSLGLAPKTVEEIYGKLKEINGAGVPLLIVEQNVRKALSVAHHVFILSQGQVIYDGPPESVNSDEILLKLYLAKR